ncbi:MAG: cytochrome C, partial [Deltaproteobacteria bacterium]
MSFRFRSSMRLFLLSWGILLFLAGSGKAGEDDGTFQEQAARFAQQCSKCHTIGQGDRVGPDLKDVTKRR